jgi:hypothetical protein
VRAESSWDARPDVTPSPAPHKHTAVCGLAESKYLRRSHLDARGNVEKHRGRLGGDAC